MTGETAALVWAMLGAMAFCVAAVVGALYLRITGQLDDTSAKLQAVAEGLADLAARITIMERNQ